MSRKQRFQISKEQRFRRKHRRKKLLAAGKDLKSFYYGKYYLKSAASAG